MRHNLVETIRTNLGNCGYSDRLLQTDYSYEDELGDHVVPLAGFSHPVFDSRTSCISVIHDGNSHDAAQAKVNSLRGLGTPVVFVCCPETVEWWKLGIRGAEHKETIACRKIGAFFEKHKPEFAPDRIRRAKNLGNIIKDQQLYFVDAGLMPLVEHEMGERLGGLMERVLCQLQDGFTPHQLKKATNQRWLFRAAFWPLCARILRDKRVKKFANLDLDDVGAVFKTVDTHYNAGQPVSAETKKQKAALNRATREIRQFTSLSNLTTEAFGYMYENALVDKDLRAALGIHATPSYLVDYIVWQLWPWLREIPQEKRIVLEPACGHAPFLASAMRLLRELFTGDETTFHKYAQRSLVGVEVDPFAREIARLSLTLADVPNPNGWRILDADIYQSGILQEKAREAMVLLCNPPFEDFTAKEKRACQEVGQELTFNNKAAEMLWRTLPHMPEGALFGVVLPRRFLSKKNLAEIRRMVLCDFDIREICLLPKRIFRHAQHESLVLSGRKRTGRAMGNGMITYRQVSGDAFSDFRERYSAHAQNVPQSMFINDTVCDLRLIILAEIWKYCREHLRDLGTVAEGGQGLIYKGRELPEDARTYDVTRFRGAVEGYAVFNERVSLHGLPHKYWMNLDREVIRRPAWGLQTGRAQILVNYAPVGKHWRVKALIDRLGYPVTSRFLVFRPVNSEWSLNALWAVLNGPLANAYVFAHTTDRDIPAGVMRQVPIPEYQKTSMCSVEKLVDEYFSLMEAAESRYEAGIRDEAKSVLLRIDAEVLRLYDLPPKMEKRVLDLFSGSQRKGVDFEFKGYYPAGFESAIPLHEYLSEEYQRSTIAFADEWVRKNRSSEMGQVFRNAVEAFE